KLFRSGVLGFPLENEFHQVALILEGITFSTQIQVMISIIKYSPLTSRYTNNGHSNQTSYFLN
uniref:Ovule protein n=1 Tax=Parascaris univalens TaxID=6257 RepID=A0A914ZK01_PARUN